MSLAHHLLTMAWQNAWANHRLLGACARLSDEELGATRTSFFPSLRHTLNHLLTVDWYYVDAIERALDRAPPHPDPDSFFRPEQPFEQCGPLAEAQRAVDRRLIAACARLSDEDLERPVAVPRRHGILQEPLTRLLSHLFAHQIHHRGQAHAMLAGTSVAPPQLDEFFCAHEAHLRAEELADLGATEGSIWGPPADEALPGLLSRMVAPRDRAVIRRVVQRLPDEGRATPPEVVLDPERGVIGDRWGLGKRNPDSMVTLMRWDVAALLAPEPAIFGDNLFASLDTSAANLPPGALLRVGGARCVVTSKPHTGCAKFVRRSSKAALALFDEPTWAEAQLRGVHLRVLDGGPVRIGDAIEVLSRE